MGGMGGGFPGDGADDPNGPPPFGRTGMSGDGGPPGWVLVLAARLRARWDREEGPAARGVEDQGPTVDRMAARRVVATRLGRRRLEGRLASEW